VLPTRIHTTVGESSSMATIWASIRNRTRSRCDHHGMVGLCCRVRKARLDVLRDEVRVVVENLCFIGPSSQEREHVGDPHARAPNCGTAVDDIRVDRDSCEQ